MKRAAYKRETPQLGLIGVHEETNVGVGDGHDFFPTPQWPTLAIWPFIYSPEVRIVLDPCCGDGGILGAIASVAYPLTFLGLEIDRERAARCEMRTNIRPDVCDALERPWPVCDLVVTNPPFNLAEEFVRLAIGAIAAGRIRVAAAFLLRLAFLETDGRVELHKQHPSEANVLANRPSFIDPQAWRPCPTCKGRGGDLAYDPPVKCSGCNGRGEVKGGTDSTAYAWFVWRADGRGAGTWRVLPDRDPAKKVAKRRRS